MKRIVILVLAVAFAMNARAQGTIYFANSAQFPVYTNNAIGNYGNAPLGTFHVALYWGILGSTAAQLIQIGPTIGGVAAGIFDGGVYTTPNGTPPGGNAVLEVKGWTGNFTTYEAASSAAQTNGLIQIDTSGIWTKSTGLNASSPANLILGEQGFNCLFLANVPEPTTVTLAIAGGAVMALAARRRKK
jgi:hypothetical protein